MASTNGETAAPVVPPVSMVFKTLHQDSNTVTLLLDSEFFEQRPKLSHNPADWDSDVLKVIVPDISINIRLYSIPSTRNQSRPQVVAAQFDLANFDAIAATNLIQQHLGQWLDDHSHTRAPAASVAYDRRTGRAIPRGTNKDAVVKAPMVPTSSPYQAAGGDNRPTLLSLVAKLGDPNVTTIEQRHAIRHIITDYLNNEISHGKVFSYIGQVIGYQALDNIISSLTTNNQPENTTNNNGIIKTGYQLERPVISKTPIAEPAISAPKFTPALVSSSSAGAQKASKNFFTKTFTRPLRWMQTSLSLNIVGHSLGLFDRKAFIFGGSSFEEGKKLKLNSSDCMDDDEKTQTTINILDLDSIKFKTASTLDGPPTLLYHTSHIGCFASGPMCVLYGGLGLTNDDNEAAKYVKINTRLHGMDLLTRRWLILDEDSKVRPRGRYGHASAIFPHNTAVVTGTVAAYAEYLLIYGGVGSSNMDKSDEILLPVESTLLMPFQDLWIFNFITGQWSNVEFSEGPCARFGISFLWSSASSLIVYGGEGRATSGASAKNDESSNSPAMPGPPGGRVIYSDTWMLNIQNMSSKNSESVDQTEACRVLPQFSWHCSNVSGVPRAHYAGLALTACLSPIGKPVSGSVEPPTWRTSVESCMSDLQNSGWDSQRLIFLISGVTQAGVDDLAIVETPSVLIGILSFNENQQAEVSWRLLDNISISPGHVGPGFLGRQGHAAAFFDSLAELPANQMLRQALKSHSLFLKKEKQIKSRSDYHPEPTTNGSYKIATSVPCIIVIGGCSGDIARQDIWVLKLSKLFPRFMSQSKAGPLNRRLMTAMVLSGFKCVPALKGLYEIEETEEDGITEDDIKVLETLWSEPSRNFSPALFQLGPVSSAGLIWSLGTMVKCPLTAVGHLVNNSVGKMVGASNVSISLEKWKGLDVLTVTDDGVGLSHKAMHILLKRFGNGNEDLTQSDTDVAGLGFKLAVGRLTHNALILTKSAVAFGVGLFSASLNRLLGTCNFACPIACWSTADGYPLALPAEEAEFGQTVSLIIEHSPLQKIEELEREFQLFGEATGTRIIFFGLRKDLPFAYVSDDNQIYFTSFRASRKLEVPTASSARPLGRSKNEIESNEKGIQLRLPEPLNEFSICLEKKCVLSEGFPFYASAKNSLDYNLATYLFWQHLHLESKLYLNGTLLKSNETISSNEQSIEKLKQNGIELSPEDRYSNSLWRLLQSRLHYKLEFPYLIEPKLGECNFYGIIGFLNPHLENATTSHTWSETGVLLYHKGRLISRACLPLPLIPDFLIPPFEDYPPTADTFTITQLTLTAIINLPDFLLPRADKEGFLCDSDIVMHDLYDKFEIIIKEYLSVYSDTEKLSKLQQRYISKFDTFRSTQWNDRKKLKNHKSNSEILPTSKIEDPNNCLKKEENDLNLEAVGIELPGDEPRDSKRRREFEEQKFKRKRRAGGRKRSEEDDDESGGFDDGERFII